MKTIATLLIAGTMLAFSTPARAQSGVAADTSHRATTRAMTRAMTRAERRERREDAREAAGKAERHPEIRAAIRSLERAKVALEHASHDFGGHRADALKSVDESLKQLRLALQYDTK